MMKKRRFSKVIFIKRINGLKIFILFLSIIVFGYPCISKSQNKQLSLSIKDSLIKYSGVDSILIIDTNSIIFVGKANNVNFGIWNIEDSIIIFYQSINNNWLSTDTIIYNLPFSFVKRVDLNGDHLNDIKISTLSGSAGNTENLVLLFDNKSQLFKHNEYYDLPNIEFEAKNHFIKSSWFAGVVHCQSKWKYNITGDSLTFDEGVQYCPDEKKFGKKGTVEFYKEEGEKRIIIKKEYGKADKIWKIFEQALWNSSEE